MKTISRFFGSLLMTAVLIGSVSCSDNRGDSQLKEEVEDFQNECPVNLGTVGEITEVKYDHDDKVVSLFIDISEEESIHAIESDPDAQGLALLQTFADSETLDLISLAREAGASLNVTYRNPDAGIPCTVILSNQDLSNIISQEDMTE